MTFNPYETAHHGFMYRNPQYETPLHSRHQDLKLATIYVRPQIYKGINSISDTLKQGTAFSELYRPFIDKSGGFN